MQLKYIFAAAALAVMANQSPAASLNLTDTVTYSGGVSVVTPAPGPGQTGPISPTVSPISFGITNAFNGSPVSSDFTSSIVGNGGPWNFYDDYVFTVGAGSTVQSALISFDQAGLVGISNLQGRIISVNSPFNPLANLLGPASGNTLIDSWTNTSLGGGIFTVNLNQHAFGPGTYALQVRGEVGSSLSGGYGGSISFTPVPLPAALPLLLSGLALLARRRKGLGTHAPVAA